MAYDIGPKIGMDGEAEFRKQLTEINASLKTLDTELKKVASEFQDNAESQDALISKNKVLAKTLETEKKKIEEVKKALEAAKENYGENSTQAQKWQQVLNRSETTLNNLEAEIRKNDQALEEMASGMRDAATGAKILDNSLDGIDDSKLSKTANAAENLSDKLSGVSKTAAGIGAAMLGTVPATQELRRDLSFLEENSKRTGNSMLSAEKAFKIFNSTSGETDSAIEGVSNLLQAGFTESNLEKAVMGLAGAATRFPDTLKIEGLADGLQETLATGKAIGPFAELLDRLGIGAANFDKELAKCNTSAEKQNLVLETLAKAGLMDSYKGWVKSNKELVDYENQVLDMQMALGDFAKTAAPIVTNIAKAGTKLIEAFNGAPKPIKATAGGLIAITAAASPTISIVGKTAKAINLLNNKESELGKTKTALTNASSKLFNVLKNHPYALVAAAAAGMAFAIYKGIESMNAETRAAQKAAQARSSAITSVQAQNREIDLYYQKLNELSAVENKSATQKQLMQQYVDKLNESVEGLNLTYDAENDKLNQTTDAIYKKIKAEKEEAIQIAFRKQAQKALEDYAETQIKIADKQTELAQAEAKYNEIARKGSSITYQEAQEKANLLEQINGLNREINDLTTASAAYNQEAIKITNQAAMQGSAWRELKDQAKQAGIDIPQSLINGLNEGKYAVPTTINELNSLISFQAAADKAGPQGAQLVNNLSAQIAAGEITVDEATKILTGTLDSNLNSSASKAGNKGRLTGSNYASGVSSASGTVNSAGIQIAAAGEKGASSVSFKPAGKAAGVGYAYGIKDAIRDAAEAARSIARAALAAAKKESQVRSPSRKWRKELGRQEGKGYVLGLKDMVSEAEAAGTELSNAGFFGASSNKMINASLFNEEKITAVAQAQFSAGFDYERLAEIMRMNGIYLEGRLVGRAMKEAGVVVR